MKLALCICFYIEKTIITSEKNYYFYLDHILAIILVVIVVYLNKKKMELELCSFSFHNRKIIYIKISRIAKHAGKHTFITYTKS